MGVSSFCWPLLTAVKLMSSLYLNMGGSQEGLLAQTAVCDRLAGRQGLYSEQGGD